MTIQIRLRAGITHSFETITRALALVGCGAAILAAESSFASGRSDLCALLTPAEVGRALKVTIVRAEALDTDEVGCEFSAKGTPSEAGAGHMNELAKSLAAANGTTLDASTQNLINAFGKGVMQGSDSDKAARAGARHSGEVPVLIVALQPGDAVQQMRVTRSTYSSLSPTGVTTIAGLGDDAFDSGGAMLTVRKGATMIQFRYPSCTCTSKDVIPLARKVVNAL